MMEDEFIPDYEFGSDIEPPSPPKIQGATKSKKGKPCPVCLAKFTHVKRHIIKDHLPWYASPSTCCSVCHINFGQAHFLDIHNQKNHNNNYTSQHLDIFWVDFMFGLLLRIIQILKLENFENLYKFINNDERFECCQGSVFSDEDSVVGERFLNHKFSGEKIPLVPYPVTNAACLLHWKILSILINLSNSAELLTKVFKKYVVWILGSSFVYWSEKRATELGVKNLEFDKDVLEIFWKGVRGMKWESLIDIIEFCKSKFPNPDFIIIHLGSNDIKFACSKRLFSQIQRDLNAVMKEFSWSHILFSEILSRLVWRNLKWTEGEKERTIINSEVKKILDREHFIHHPKIIARKSYLFRDDGVHLSDIGNDYLIEDFKLWIKHFIV